MLNVDGSEIRRSPVEVDKNHLVNVDICQYINWFGKDFVAIKSNFFKKDFEFDIPV